MPWTADLAAQNRELVLAIVRRAAEDSGATMSAGNHPNGGAILTMRWPDEQPEDAPRTEGPG